MNAHFLKFCSRYWGQFVRDCGCVLNFVAGIEVQEEIILFGGGGEWCEMGPETVNNNSVCKHWVRAKGVVLLKSGV